MSRIILTKFKVELTSARRKSFSRPAAIEYYMSVYICVRLWLIQYLFSRRRRHIASFSLCSQCLCGKIPFSAEGDHIVRVGLCVSVVKSISLFPRRRRHNILYPCVLGVSVVRKKL